MANQLVTEAELQYFYSLSSDDQQHFLDQVPLWNLKEEDDIDEKAAKIAVKASQKSKFL